MTARNKIAKPISEPVSDLEVKVAEALVDLESTVEELKTELRTLQISSVKELEVGHGKKSIVVFVPVPMLKGFRKIQTRLVRELEKKFSDRPVLIVAQRRILPKESRKSRVKQARPRSRTLAAVHESTLEDLVYPTEIVGKRIRVKKDGSKIIKVFLDRKDHGAIDYKLDTFSSVYKKLTGKDVFFTFNQTEA